MNHSHEQGVRFVMHSLKLRTQPSDDPAIITEVIISSHRLELEAPETNFIGDSSHLVHTAHPTKVR